MLPDYPQTAGHCPHELHTQHPATHAVSARAGTPPICPIQHPDPLPAVPGGKRVDRDRMGAGSSQRMDAGKSWTTPSAATEGGATVEVAERAAQKCRASRERASSWPLLTQAGDERAPGEGRTLRRVLSASPTPRAARLAEVAVCLSAVPPQTSALSPATAFSNRSTPEEGRQE